ncbi:MAG: D,D-dipeptide ABC transporter permease, partial [Chloroflexota bacterium]
MSINMETNHEQMAAPGKRWEGARKSLKWSIQQPLLTISVVIIVMVIIVSIAAPWLAPYEPDHQILLDRLQTPSATYLLGT